MTKATKGSQLHLQTYVNKYSEALNQDIFSHSPSLMAYTHGKRKIIWKSPLAHENYKEYQDDFLSHITVMKTCGKYPNSPCEPIGPKTGQCGMG